MLNESMVSLYRLDLGSFNVAVAVDLVNGPVFLPFDALTSI